VLFAAAQNGQAQATRAQLEISETFFTLFASLNSCGYEAGMPDSLPLRQTVREEVQEIVQKSPEALRSRDAVCQFWREHQVGTSSSDIGQYISLALELGAPPIFSTKLPEADLPPDAAHVLGVIPLLQKFYKSAGMAALWQKHRAEYESLVQQYHDALASTITETDLYLKIPFTNYAGQRFAVYLEPMLSPATVASRNYGSQYLVVLSPGKEGKLKTAEVRHTYLHFVLDPFAQAHGTSLKRLEPLLEDIRTAPLDRSFKEDVALMVNECLIRAIETRTAISRNNERAREAYVQRSVQEGFVLTRYFYDALANFEKESTGLKTAYGDLLHNVDLERERKRAREVAFALQAEPEVVSAARVLPQGTELLNQAEQKLASGDKEGAQKLALQVVRSNQGGDQPGRAAFLLARIATLSGNMEEARADFEQAAQSAKDPRTLAWSHIYLGRIYDIQQKRDAAMEHYRAALAAGDPLPDTRAAAEKGLAAPYQRPGPPK
jgi:tetratricopeptide (TPR) repeat protein